MWHLASPTHTSLVSSRPLGGATHYPWSRPIARGQQRFVPSTCCCPQIAVTEKWHSSLVTWRTSRPMWHRLEPGPNSFCQPSWQRLRESHPLWPRLGEFPWRRSPRVRLEKGLVDPKLTRMDNKFTPKPVKGPFTTVMCRTTCSPQRWKEGGGAQPSTRQPGRHQSKSPVRDNPPRRSLTDQHTQDHSRRRSREREGRSESAYNTYHRTGQLRRPSPKLFGRIHYPSRPKDLSQARIHRDFRSPDESTRRKRRKKSKASRSRPRTRSWSPDRHSCRSRSPWREPGKDRVDYSDLPQPGPLPETFARGPTTHDPRAEATVSRADQDVRRVEQSPPSHTVTLSQPQDPPCQRVQRKEWSPVSVTLTGDPVPSWLTPIMDRMLTMFASQHPPTTTPAATVQSPVAVSPPDNPTSPTIPGEASKDRLSTRQNIRITPNVVRWSCQRRKTPVNRMRNRW